MSKSSKSFTSIVIESLGWPLFWGLAATFAFYLLVFWGVFQSNLVTRYFAGHPVEYVETALFFVGVVALLLRGADLAFQFSAFPKIQLAAAREHGDSVTRAGELSQAVSDLSQRLQETYLARRLASALRYVRQSDSAEGLDEQLRYLSDVDAERSHDGYSLVRMIVWATPMLGFLGTVIGITLALGNLSPEALVDAPKEAMQGLLAGLSVAFDTTALALSLSIVLMFLQFLVREVETQLLTAVDRRVEDELMGRFATHAWTSDPQIAAFTNISARVMDSVERLTQAQAESLQQTIADSQQQWSDALLETQATMKESLQHTVVELADRQARVLALAEETASQRVGERWASIHEGIQQQTEILANQQQALMGQADVMHRVLEATGDVRNLETSLNHNLSALAGAKNFQDTVMSLSAAIQLLTSRLGISSQNVSLHSEQERAA